MKNFATATLLLLFFGMILSACHKPKTVLDAPNEEKLLQSLMAGSYNSANQAARDTDYYQISLKMVPIWVNKPGTWLYVEQAMASKTDKPYRQRIYKLEQTSKNTFVSKVYTLKNEKDAVGKYLNSSWFNQYDLDILEERTGCHVVLKRIADDIFEGSTEGKGCPSNLRGSAYATSIVRIEKDKIVSWDQGFDEKGKQVWGATKGGYIFDKEAGKKKSDF